MANTGEAGASGQHKFAGPLAQGVLDPLISHVPSAVLVPSVNLDKEHPRGHGP